ncbi:MAG: hypothetical protein ACOCQA_01710 [bacterium]
MKRFQIKGQKLLKRLWEQIELEPKTLIFEDLAEWLDTDVRYKQFFEGEEAPFKNLEDQWLDITIDTKGIKWIICEDINQVGNHNPAYIDRWEDGWEIPEVLEFIEFLEQF